MKNKLKKKYHPSYTYTPDECKHQNLETIMLKNGSKKGCYDCGEGFYSDIDVESILEEK